jgi:hypothetical protein
MLWEETEEGTRRTARRGKLTPRFAVYGLHKWISLVGHRPERPVDGAQGKHTLGLDDSAVFGRPRPFIEQESDRGGCPSSCRNSVSIVALAALRMSDLRLVTGGALPCSRAVSSVGRLASCAHPSKSVSVRERERVWVGAGTEDDEAIIYPLPGARSD